MEKLKKILLITSLSALGVAAVMLMLAVFSVPIFEGVQLRILLIISTLAIASGIAINEINVIKRQRILGFVGLALLILSAVFAIILFCSNLLLSYNIFTKITLITAVSSILFIIIITTYSRLLRTAFALQIAAYSCLAIIDVVLSILIGGYNLFQLPAVLHIFIIICIAAVALLIAVAVIGAKNRGNLEVKKHPESMILVDKNEYEMLKHENQELKAELEKYKSINQPQESINE